MFIETVHDDSINAMRRKSFLYPSEVGGRKSKAASATLSLHDFPG
jgi:hypothetical protein